MTNSSGASVLPEAVPAIGSASGGLRFELVLPPDNLEDRDDPFVPLSDSGRFSRVLLARIAIGQDTTLRPLALKIQRSFYRPYGAGQGQITNSQVDEIWARERENLMKLRVPEVVELLDLGPELMRSYPVTFCKKVRKYFHPLCPQCTGMLEDCRDDALLREFGLPTYSGSLARYLYCSTCSDAHRAVFYTYSLTAEEHPKGAVEIRRRSELYRDLMAVARGDHSPAKKPRVERIFPCFTCKHRDTCYPLAASGTAIPAEKMLVPLSFYEFAMLPMDLLQLHYDEFVDLAGGASWSDIRRNAEGTAAGRAQSLAPVDAVLSGPMQWIFGTDLSAGYYWIEVLRLKLLAFTQLCRGVRALHARTTQPHLGLDPTTAMVVMNASGPDLPARWNFQVKLLDPANPHRFPPLANLLEAAGDVYVPSPDCDKTYLSPLVRKAGTGREESMRVTIRSLAPEGAGCRAEVDVLSPRVRLHEFRVRDIVRVVATSPVSWLEGVELWGSIVEPLDGGFRCSVYANRPVTGKVPVTFDGSVAFYQRFGIPCDLYSLGMLLFRTTLVNDEQDIFAIEDAVTRVVNKLTVGLEGAIQPDYKYVSGMLSYQIDTEKKTFHAKNALYSKLDRDTRLIKVPGMIWSDLMLLGFRLVLNIPDFSFAAHHADYDPAKPESVLDAVLQSLDTINTRLHVELFGTVDRAREVTAACDELIAEITRDGLGGYEVEEEDPGLEKAEFQPEP